MVKMTLKAARINANLSQKDAAKLLNISNKTLSSWENGHNVPKVDMVQKLCELYRIDYDAINFLTNG